MASYAKTFLRFARTRVVRKGGPFYGFFLFCVRNGCFRRLDLISRVENDVTPTKRVRLGKQENLKGDWTLEMDLSQVGPPLNARSGILSKDFQFILRRAENDLYFALEDSTKHAVDSVAGFTVYSTAAKKNTLKPEFNHIRIARKGEKFSVGFNDEPLCTFKTQYSFSSQPFFFIQVMAKEPIELSMQAAKNPLFVFSNVRLKISDTSTKTALP
jgi:hypothetical protein